MDLLFDSYDALSLCDLVIIILFFTCITIFLPNSAMCMQPGMRNWIKCFLNFVLVSKSHKKESSFCLTLQI